MPKKWTHFWWTHPTPMGKAGNCVTSHGHFAQQWGFLFVDLGRSHNPMGGFLFMGRWVDLEK